MKGYILSVEDSQQFEFRGKIRGEDGIDYLFNKFNFQDKQVKLSDLTEGQAVEFDKKPPNASGNIYPNNIRFSDQTGVNPSDNGHKINHSHGTLRNFPLWRIPTIRKVLSDLSDNDQLEAENERWLLNKIATTYSELDDTDIYEHSGVSFDYPYCAQSILFFPSGFCSASGEKIYIYCEKSSDSKSNWVSAGVFGKNKIFYCLSFNDVVKADWYDIKSDLKELCPEVDRSGTTVDDIIKHIESSWTEGRRSFIMLNSGARVPDLYAADTMFLPTGYKSETGAELFLRCVTRGTNKGIDWFYESVVYPKAPLKLYPKKLQLHMWAIIKEDVYKTLASQTLPEKWSFAGRSDFYILKNYLTYTFAHQWSHNGISYSEDRKYAAFNTGLPDKNTYSYLYALFEKLPDNQYSYNDLYYIPQYRFKAFTIQGQGGAGKELSMNISPLPSPSRYFEKRGSTVWELEFDDNNEIKQPIFDDKHILITRCERVPMEFYKNAVHGSAQFDEIMLSKDPDEEKYNRIRSFFTPTVFNNIPDDEVTRAYRQLYNAFKVVVDTAIRKLAWNWRAVVPCYNPERDENCFLLPASFSGQDKPDRAFIATATGIEGGKQDYQIHTVISLEMAYLDARLVCRPESEWLIADCL